MNFLTIGDTVKGDRFQNIQGIIEEVVGAVAAEKGNIKSIVFILDDTLYIVCREIISMLIGLSRPLRLPELVVPHDEVEMLPGVVRVCIR